jgi:SAM-dependent methyltransferase
MAAGAANCAFIKADAYDVADKVACAVDFLLMANTFHGVPDKARLSRVIAAALTPGGRVAIVNCQRRPREETTVVGQPRGPKTELQMEPGDISAVIAAAGLELVGVVERPPYHYGAIFEKPAGRVARPPRPFGRYAMSGFGTPRSSTSYGPMSASHLVADCQRSALRDAS